MKTKLRIECDKCKHGNEIEVGKAFINPDSPEPKVKVFLPSYLSKQTQKCTTCNVVLCEPDEMFRIENGEAARYRIRNL